MPPENYSLFPHFTFPHFSAIMFLGDNMEIKFETDKRRAAIYDNDIEIGFCTYEEQGDAWAVTHTGVSPEYRGMGLAEKVLLCVLENAEKENREIIPICSYAVRYMEKNKK